MNPLTVLFVIFGLKRRDRDYGPAYPAHCANCNNDEYMHIYKWRNWFHIFWIPLIPWSANRAMVCPICGYYADLDRSEFKKAVELARDAKSVQAGDMPDQMFLQRVKEFEREVGWMSEEHSIGEGDETLEIDEAEDGDVRGFD